MYTEQNLILQRVLRGKTEFKHRHINNNENRPCCKCEHYFGDGGSNDNEPCLIADPLTNPDGNLSTDADIASEIQEWMKTASKVDRSTYRIFLERKYRQGKKEWSWEDFSWWLIFDCNDSDRIDGFIKSMEV